MPEVNRGVCVEMTASPVSPHPQIAPRRARCAASLSVPPGDGIAAIDLEDAAGVSGVVGEFVEVYLDVVGGEFA